MHGIHIDITWEWFSLRRNSHISILVLVDGHLDLNFLLTTLIDRLGKAKKSRMWTSSFLGEEALMRVSVHSLDTLLVSIFNVVPNLVVRGGHGVLSSQYWTRRRRDELDIVFLF